MTVRGDEEDHDQRGEGRPAQQRRGPGRHVGPVRGTRPVTLEHPDAVGVGRQRHREQARGAQQPAERLPGVAGDDERSHERAADAGERSERPSVLRPRRLAHQRAVRGGEHGVRDGGENRQPEGRPGDPGTHVNPPGRRRRGWGGARPGARGPRR